MSTAAVNKQAPTPAKTAPVTEKPASVPTAPASTAPAPVATAATAAKARAGRKLVPENETDEQAFRRLTVPRVEKALKACKQLQNLSRFKPSEAHREKVFSAIRAALTLAETSWKGSTPTAEGFSL